MWDKEDASNDHQRPSRRKQGGLWLDHSQRGIVQYLGCDCHVELSDWFVAFPRIVSYLRYSTSWLEGEDYLVRDQYIDQNESEVGDWDFFVRSVIQFLRSAQIIQLVLSSWYPSSWNYDRSDLLRHLGLFSTWDGVLVNDQVSPMSDNWVPLDIVDDDVGNFFAHMDNAKEVERKWEKYREARLPKERKGKLFLQTTTERGIMCKISETS